MLEKSENELSNIIIGCAIEVYKQLSRCLLESAYNDCLLFELKKQGLDVVKEWRSTSLNTFKK